MDAKHHTFFLHKPYGLYIKAAFCLTFALAGGFMAATGLLVPDNDVFGWSPVGLFLFGFGAFLLCLAFTFFFYAQARYTRLVISPHGIAYHAPGYSLYAAWEAVAAIKRIPRLNIGEGLTLHEATAVYRHSLNTLSPPYDRFIPLMGFGWDWDEQEIGQLIRMYKPVLFAAEPDVTTPPHQA